jgi:hypothetical protein
MEVAWKYHSNHSIGLAAGAARGTAFPGLFPEKARRRVRPRS